MKSNIKVVIPAAGEPELARKTKLPTALIDINGKTVLERQIETLNKAGLDTIALIKGFGSNKFKLENITYFTSRDYKSKSTMHSIFKAEKEFTVPFICIFSDILFNLTIISSLLNAAARGEKDIILVVDDSYEYHKHDLHKKLDLVRTNKQKTSGVTREIMDLSDEKITYIGKQISQEAAHYEFIGISYFSQKGISILKDVYKKLVKKKTSKLAFTVVIQAIVDAGYPVHVLKTHKGWMEIHNEDDIKLAKKFYRA